MLKCSIVFIKYSFLRENALYPRDQQRPRDAAQIAHNVRVDGTLFEGKGNNKQRGAQ